MDHEAFSRYERRVWERVGHRARGIPGVTVTGSGDHGQLPHDHQRTDTGKRTEFRAARQGVPFAGRLLRQLAAVTLEPLAARQQRGPAPPRNERVLRSGEVELFEGGVEREADPLETALPADHRRTGPVGRYEPGRIHVHGLPVLGDESQGDTDELTGERPQTRAQSLRWVTRGCGLLQSPGNLRRQDAPLASGIQEGIHDERSYQALHGDKELVGPFDVVSRITGSASVALR